MHHDRRQRHRHSTIHLHRRHRHTSQMIMSKPQRITKTKRRPTRHQLIQRRTQRIQISTLIHRPPRTPRLLRRQILQRPHNLRMVRELRTDLSERRRQSKIDQTRRTTSGHHDIRRRDIPMHHTPPMHPRHRPSQPHRQPDHLIDHQRLHQPRQTHPTNIRHHDRPRIPRRLHQLSDPLDATQPLENRYLVLEPAQGVRSQWFLTHDGIRDSAASEDQARDPRPFGFVDCFGADRRILGRQLSVCLHPNLRTAGHPL